MAARTTPKRSTSQSGLTLNHFYILLAVLLLVAFLLDTGTGILAVLIWYASGTIGAARVRRLYVKPKAAKATKTTSTTKAAKTPRRKPA